LQEKHHSFQEYLFKIILLLNFLTHRSIEQIYAVIVQFSGYVYIICFNWAQDQRLGPGNDLTPTALSKLENKQKLKYYGCEGTL